MTKEQMRHIMEDNGHEVSLYYMLYEKNGFVFAKRERLRPPSRCPLCRMTSIARPRYFLGKREKGKG